MRIDRNKYELVREAILRALGEAGELTFGEMTALLQSDLAARLDGSVSWYVTTVKLDLEARGLIRRIPRSRPQRLVLVEMAKG